jgi:hypothetical protein
MTDRAKDEVRLLARTFFRAGPIGAAAIGLIVPLPFVVWFAVHDPGWWLVPIGACAVSWTMAALSARKRFRFRHPAYASLWDCIQDRLERFDRAYGHSPRIVRENLSGTPESVHRIGDSMYLALRRADSVRALIEENEPRDMPNLSRSEPIAAADAKARDLYGLALRNREEYREHYQKLMGGVERTEAQAAVLISSLDSLRLKMLDYRVTGGKIEMPEDDLLPQLQAYRDEFRALEQAVDEVETEFLLSG